MYEKGNNHFPEAIRVFPLYLSGVHHYAVPLFIERVRCQTADWIWHAGPFCRGISTVVLQLGKRLVYVLAHRANGDYFDIQSVL